MLVNWFVTKRLEGVLGGIVVHEYVSADASLGQPFKAGQRVNGLGGAYIVLSCIESAKAVAL